MEWGKRESIYLSLHCHHQNDQHYDGQRRELFQCFINCEGQIHKTVSTNYNI